MSHACIILCHDNDERGEPDATTIARLRAAQAHLGQASCIVLAGYERQNASMTRWLHTQAGTALPVYSVIAHDTIGQAVFTAPVIRALGVTTVTVVTSDYHLPRTRAIFDKVHGGGCELSFVGATHPVENRDVVVRAEQESLAAFTERFARATTLFDYMAILFDHHPRYQHIELHPASQDEDGPDSRAFWAWRNDATTRQMSRSTDAITWDAHRAWYARAAHDPTKAIVMASVNGIPACMVRFDALEAGAAEININMNPAMRGKKLGRSILAAACAYGFGTLNLSRIYAEIKPDNAVSIKIFEGVGFRSRGRRGDLHAYELGRGEAGATDTTASR